MIPICGGKTKTPVRVWNRRFSLWVNLWIRFRGSEEAEPTAALGICHVYITQKGGLLLRSRHAGIIPGFEVFHFQGTQKHVISKLC